MEGALGPCGWVVGQPSGVEGGVRALLPHGPAPPASDRPERSRCQSDVLQAEGADVVEEGLAGDADLAGGGAAVAFVAAQCLGQEAATKVINR